MANPVHRTELTPVSFLRRSACVFRDKTAVVHGGRRYTYREMEARVNRLASRLRADGLRKHDRVAFLCPNTPAMLEAHFAVPAAGGILVAINTRLASGEIDYILRHSGARVLFVDAELTRLVEPLDTRGINVVRVDDTGLRGDPYEDYLAGGSPDPTVAGAPPSPTIIGELRRLGFRPIHVYGLTETYGPHTICEWRREWDARSAEEQARLLARQGQAYVIADLVRVVDDRMADVPRDAATMGEVCMRGNNVMTGYFEDPRATAEAFRGGWFHSEDVGVWHPDGDIELRDRSKDIIISGGENISIIEVEQTVARHPAVLECAVVAIPDEKWGERPKAFVTLKPGRTATAEEIIAFCRERLTRFKCPAAVEFGELPKTSTGKVQKFVLREKEWRGRDRRIH